MPLRRLRSLKVIRNAVIIGETMRPENEETLRSEKVEEARRKMFQLVDDPLAVCVVCDKLAETISPPSPEKSNKPRPRRGFFS